MILGHGIDITDINRIKKSYLRFGEKFINKFLAEEEIKLKPKQDDKIVHFLAKHWAVKEAVSKAVGCGLINGSPLHFKDIVLSYTWSRMPIINVTHNLAEITSQMHALTFNDLQNIAFHISTSGDAGVVIASAILELKN